MFTGLTSLVEWQTKGANELVHVRAGHPLELLRKQWSTLISTVHTICVKRSAPSFPPRLGYVSSSADLGTVSFLCEDLLVISMVHQWTFCVITYGPHKAVAEVSNHNEPIGRKSGIELVRKIRKSMDFTFSCFVLN